MIAIIKAGLFARQRGACRKLTGWLAGWLARRPSERRAGRARPAALSGQPIYYLAGWQLVGLLVAPQIDYARGRKSARPLNISPVTHRWEEIYSAHDERQVKLVIVSRVRA